MNEHKDGVLLCAQYAVSPNFFGYCGPDKSLSVRQHLASSASDEELTSLLTEFETLYPYLKLIARANKVDELFNPQVVEAYWIGNDLLKNSTKDEYYSFMKELLHIEKKVDVIQLQQLRQSLSRKRFVYPHHSFHVCNIFRMYGSRVTPEIAHTINECRISSGIVLGLGNKESTVFIKTDSIREVNGTVILIPDTREVSLEFIPEHRKKMYVKGVLVSVHWGYICDIITSKQTKNLSFYTKYALEFYRQSLKNAPL